MRLLHTGPCPPRGGLSPPYAQHVSITVVCVSQTIHTVFKKQYPLHLFINLKIIKMKHKLMLLMTALTLFANSCTTTDKPFPVNTPTDWSPLGPDGLAVAEGFATFGEFAVTPVSGFVVGAAIAIFAADASGLFGRQTNAMYSSGKPSNVILPYAKELTNNPFEQIGKMHNIGLDYMNKKGDFTEWRNRLIHYDIAAWEEMIDVVSPGMADSDKIQIINAAKQARLVERVQAKMIYTGTINQQEAIARLSISSSGQAYINSVLISISELRASGKSMLQVADYLNGEIAARINPKNIYTTEEKAILAFLTVAKHSGYYWHN
jgi:hypothetical protein